MRESARESLSRGEGVATLTSDILPMKACTFIGQQLDKKEIEMPSEMMDARYVALRDVNSLLAKAAENLNRLSPHPKDDCIIALESKLVSKLSLVLVRTSSAQMDHITPDTQDLARIETDLGKKAANVASQIIKAQMRQTLTGEKYLELLGSSPMPDLTKASIRIAQAGGAQVRGSHGDFSKIYNEPLSKDVQCSEPQTLKVRIESIFANSETVTARVTGFGDHTVFWKSFTDPRLDIEVPDITSQHGMLLARVLDEEIELEVSLSISMLRGKRGVDRCKASVLKMPQLKELAVKAIRRLNSQLDLDLLLPD